MSETSVFVEGLVLPAQIGINADEIGRAQPLRLDIEVKLASAGAAASEAIADTVDYTRVAAVARDVIARRHFPLVETLAEEIADAVLEALPLVSEISLRLGKLTCMAEARAAGVALRRVRASDSEPALLEGEALARAASERHEVLILGGGPAGINAALRVARLGRSALLVDEGSALGGQLHVVYQPMPDLPGSPPQTGPSYARRIAAQLAPLGAVRLVRARATQLEADDDGVALKVGQATLRGETLIVATGLSRRELAVPGERQLRGKGLLATGSKDTLALRAKHVAIVGGGDAACENALMLADAGARVTLIHRRARFSAREQFVRAIAGEPRIRCEMNAAVKAFIGAQRLEAVELDDGRRLAVDAALVRIGWSPRAELLPAEWRDERGALRVDSAGRVEGQVRVFGAGDLIGPACLAVATAAGSAANAARSACALLEAASRGGRDD
ncbi:MAG: dihydroneopterin aldolase [Myxococcales bacterium]|nr:dihydroneopterin aldolase [Myxococcales bacterium]